MSVCRRRAVFDDGAVAQDEGQRRRQALEDRPREVVAAASGDGDLDTRVDRASDRRAIRVG